jgi:ABC-type multidrug transport system permease subunit
VEMPLAFSTLLHQYLIVYWMMGLRGNFILLFLSAFGLGMAACSVAVFMAVVAPDIKTVNELSFLLFVPQLLFAGFFIRTSQIPIFLRWAQYLTSLKYALNLMLLIEFDDSNKNCLGAAADNCKKVLSQNNIEPRLWWTYMLLLITLFVAFRAVAAVILVKKARRFY